MKPIEKLLFSDKLSSLIFNSLKSFATMMEFPSYDKALYYLIKELRKFIFYSSISFVAFLIYLIFSKKSFKEKFHNKAEILGFLICLHLFFFCFVGGFFIYYFEYYIRFYHKKPINTIRAQKNMYWSTDFYKFIQICQKTIPEDSRVLLLIKDFSGDKGKYHIYFNYFLYPRKIYIHFPQASSSVYYQKKEWVKKYKNSKISLINLDLDELKQKRINWIIAYEDSLIFSKEKAKIIQLKELRELPAKIKKEIQ